MKRKTLCLATHNQHKVAELVAALHNHWEVKSLPEFESAPEVDEIGDSFYENARLKAETVSLSIKGLVLADDSGLEVDALNGAPGIYSARYAGEPRNDTNNNERLLEKLTEVGADAPERRRARFRCVLVLAEDGKEIARFEGVCEGHIGLAPRGRHGFGYDPLFIPDDQTETFGELPEGIKARISHRAKALQQFAAWASA